MSGAPRRSAFSKAAATLLVLLLAGLTAMSSAVGQEAEDTRLQPLADCIRNRGRLAVLMVVDQSGSLEDTDPFDIRVTGIKAALAGLAELTAGEAASDVAVAIGGFDESYSTVIDFTELSLDNATELGSRAQAFADRDQGFDTDYVAAFTGAQDALNAQAVQMDPSGRDPVCRLMMLFTDGKFDIEDRLTAAQQDAHGTSKPWAPGSDLTTAGSGAALVEQGREILCRRDGLIDGGRSSEIFTAVVALETGIEEQDRSFLRSIADGEVEGQVCGVPGSAAEASGVYLPASDVDDLIAALLEVASAQPPIPPGLDPVDTCPVDEVACPDGSKRFELDSSLSRFNLLALAATTDIRVDLRSPDGDVVELARDGPQQATLPGNQLTWSWLSPTALLLTGRLSSSSTDWVGEWTVSFVDTTGSNADAVNRVAIYLFGDLQGELIEPAELRKGEEGTFGVRLVDAAGQPASPEEFREGSTITATVTVPGEAPETVPLEEQDDGTFLGRYTPRQDLRGSSVNLHLDVAVTTSQGVALPPVGTDFAIPLTNPVGFPQLVVEGGEFRLSGIDGDETASGVVRVIADEFGAGCVWLTGANVREHPDSTSDVAIDSEFGTSEGSCTPVEAGDDLELSVTADPDGTGTGDVLGDLSFQLRSASSGEVREEEMPFRFTMTRPVDRVKEVGILSALVILGTLIPIALLYLVNFLSRRFHPTDTIRWLAVDVLVSPRSVVRVDEGSVLLSGSEVHNATVAGNREFAIGRVEFRARMPKSPFSAVYGEAISDGELVVTDRGLVRGGRHGLVNLGLGGTWVFRATDHEVEGLSTDSDGESAGSDSWAVRGTMLCLFSQSEPFESQVERMTERLLSDLPERVGELRKLKAPAKEPQRGPIQDEKRIVLPDLPPDPVSEGTTGGQDSGIWGEIPDDAPAEADTKNSVWGRLRQRLGRRHPSSTSRDSKSERSAEPETPPPSPPPVGPGFDLPS